MDKRELLHHRAAILAGELAHLAQEARETGEMEAYSQLKAAGRALPHDKLIHGNTLARIEADEQKRAAAQYRERQDALDLREAQIKHRETKLDRQPKHRYPWVAAGAAIAIPASVLLLYLT